MKEKLLILAGVVTLSFVSAGKALAMCPVCAIAVGAGIGFSRWIGVDDSITGIWVGGLVVSLITWTIDWCNRKQIHFPLRDIATIVGYYVLTIVPLYFMGLAGGSTRAIAFGLDKLTIGMVVGSLAFWAAAEWYFHLKAQHGGHAYFPFQKVVMPVSALILMSVIFYVLTK